MTKPKTVAVLQAKLEAMEAENQQLKRSLLRHTMERAVLDEQMSPELLSHMEQFFPQPPSPWYLCILFFGKDASGPMPDTAPVDSISTVVADMLAEFGQPFFFSISGTVACLLNISVPPNGDDCIETDVLRQQICQALQTHTLMLQQDMGLSHIALSTVSDMDAGPRLLYRSACSASEHRKSCDSICTAQAEPTTPQTQRQPYVLEQIFWQRIAQRRFFEAASALDQILESSTMPAGSFQRCRAAVFSRMELVMDSALENAPDGLIQSGLFQDLLRKLSQTTTYLQMRDAAYDFLATLEDQLFTSANSRNRKMPQIERYIQDNVSNPALCASFIAERFRISPSYLSRIFKADMGIGLVDYIHRLRIDRTKTALVNTDDTIDKIAASVGFSNRWVFMRVFKQLEGTTPGAYRSAQGIPK